MERSKDESPDISDFERRLDQNWNERKHLTEKDFELRVEIQSLVQRGESGERFEEARGFERECRASLARNNQEYDSLIQGWAGEAFKAK